MVITVLRRPFHYSVSGILQYKIHERKHKQGICKIYAGFVIYCLAESEAGGWAITSEECGTSELC